MDFIEEHAVEMRHAIFPRAVEELDILVQQGVEERHLQAHIEAHPYLLSQQFSHCHHVFPKVRLGIQYEVDFFCLDIPSSGREWWAVELEPTKRQVITKSGRRTAHLEHALQQVRDWRQWVTHNLGYAQRDKSCNGLGLIDIETRFWGYVVIGRRQHFSTSFDSLRRQISRDEQIQIRSWDGIVEWGRKRAKIFGYKSST